MITMLLLIFGVMSAMGLGITFLYKQQLHSARQADTDGQRSPHTSMAAAHDPSPEDIRIADLQKRVTLFAWLAGFDVLVFFGLLVAKLMGFE